MSTCNKCFKKGFTSDRTLEIHQESPECVPNIKKNLCNKRLPFTTFFCSLPKGHDEEDLGHPYTCQASETPRSEPNPVGRPVTREGAKKGGYKIDADVASKLKRLADYRDRSVHDLASSIIEDWVNDQREPEDPDQLLINLL